MSDNEKPSDKPREQPRIHRHGPGMRVNVEKAKNPVGALRRLIGYLGAYRRYLTFAIALTVISTVLNLVGPYLIGVAIDQYIIPRDWNGLVRSSVVLAGIYLLVSATEVTVGWLMATVSQRSLKELRGNLFDHAQTLSLSFFDRTPAGDLMSRLTNDIDTIGVVLSQNTTELTRSVIILVGIVAAMFILNPRLAIASLFIFPIMMILTAVVGKRARSSFRALQQNMGRLNGVMQETITGQKAVIAFSQQESANRRFRKANNDVKETGTRAETYVMALRPVMGILSNVNIAIVAGVGSWMILQGLATIGTISVFIAYSRRFADPLRQFSNIYNSVQSALAGAERVFEVLDTEPEVEDAPDAVSVDRFQGDVEFKDVDFSYVPGVQVLKDVSFEADPGQRVALVGPTGAGKTTMVNVLSRFYDIQDGAITIDGYDIRHIGKDSLRRQLGVVLQDVFLFSGTVIDNIRYGRLDATDEECIEAAKMANADGFIRRLPQGYETVLSERASNLSQGQRQLLSIARAIVSNPSILVLDEATSSVDTRTEKQIQEALLRLMKGRTSFIIAHRLSTIKTADEILVINDGEIIERGTHGELMKKRGFYYNLYMSQFKGTIDDADFEYIKPVETPQPWTRSTGMKGGMGRGMGMRPSLGMLQDRIMEIAEVFREKGALSPETAMSLEKLGLPPQFSMMMQRGLGQRGVFLEYNGKYYLSEEQLRARLLTDSRA